MKLECFHGIDGMPDHYRFEHSSMKDTDWVHSYTIDALDVVRLFLTCEQRLRSSSEGIHSCGNLQESMECAIAGWGRGTL
jgi:hypothetical protein